MHYQDIIVKRKNLPDMIFKWDAGYYCKLRKYLYRLFIEPQELKPIWIAIGYKQSDGSIAWCTWERELKATKVIFSNGEFVFKRGVI